MNKGIFTGNQEGLELLALELSEVKAILRELSQQVLRIERRVKLALPPPEKATKSNHYQQLDETAAHRIIDRLTERAKEGEQIESELRNMTVKNELTALARVLGMTNTKLPPKDDLIRRISTRLRQSAFVASGIREGVQESNERIG